MSAQDSTKEARHAGGCVCGAVRYVTRGEPMRVTVCHCTWCQRRTGTAFAVEPVFNDDQVEISGGPLTTYRHISDESGRWLDLAFCPRCGTNIGLTLEWRPGVRIIDAGTFDDPSWIRADRHLFRHIFLRSAQNWSAFRTASRSTRNTSRPSRRGVRTASAVAIRPTTCERSPRS